MYYGREVDAELTVIKKLFFVSLLCSFKQIGVLQTTSTKVRTFSYSLASNNPWFLSLQLVNVSIPQFFTLPRLSNGMPYSIQRNLK